MESPPGAATPASRSHRPGAAAGSTRAMKREPGSAATLPPSIAVQRSSAGVAPTSSAMRSAAAGPPTPMPIAASLASPSVTLARRTNIARRRCTESSRSRGSSSSKWSPAMQRRVKLASTRPLGEHHADNCPLPGASAVTSLVSWPWRKLAASGPLTESAPSGPSGQTTAASRAATPSPGPSPNVFTASASNDAPRASRKAVQ